jgi:hypothetical protein
MIAEFYLILCACVGISTTPDTGLVLWGSDGLSCTGLIQRIADSSGEAFAIRADPPGTDRSRRLFCSTNAIADQSASWLVESVCGLTRWGVGDTGIWMDLSDIPGLIAADIHHQRPPWVTRATGRRMPGDKVQGDVELEDASRVESIRAIGLAFGVAIVYSSGCDLSTDGVDVSTDGVAVADGQSDRSQPDRSQPDRRLSLSLEDVDLPTCLSLMTERFKLKWSVVGDLIYLYPVHGGSRGISNAGLDAGLQDGRESVTGREMGLAEEPETSGTRGGPDRLDGDRDRLDGDRLRADRLESERLCRGFE